MLAVFAAGVATSIVLPSLRHGAAAARARSFHAAGPASPLRCRFGGAGASVHRFPPYARPGALRRKGTAREIQCQGASGRSSACLRYAARPGTPRAVPAGHGTDDGGGRMPHRSIRNWWRWKRRRLKRMTRWRSTGWPTVRHAISSNAFWTYRRHSALANTAPPPAPWRGWSGWKLWRPRYGSGGSAFPKAPRDRRVRYSV